MNYDVEHLLTLGNELGEGDLWSPEEQKLYWLDIFAGKVHRWTPGEPRYEVFLLGQPVGSLGFRASGGFIAALKTGFHFWNPDTGELQRLIDPEADKPHKRFNDGAVDPKGRFWSGTMDDHGNSALYRYDPDRSIHLMRPGVTCSNGLGFSPDHKTMYYSDSQIFTIFAYDYDEATGNIENPRVWQKREQGDPDGLTVDADGFVWIAVWDGWAVERYDPDGKLVTRIPMPVQRPTCPIFGGPNMDELYVTSAWTGLTPDQRAAQPLAGDLFRIQTDVKGVPEPKFAG